MGWSSDMKVTQLVTEAFRLAVSQNRALWQTWIKISCLVGSQLSDSLLMPSIQRAGELDIVLRSMEDDYTPPPENPGEADLFSGQYQVMLSELWVGSVYEMFRLLNVRKLTDRGDAFGALAHDLRLLLVH